MLKDVRKEAQKKTTGPCAPYFLCKSPVRYLLRFALIVAAFFNCVCAPGVSGATPAYPLKLSGNQRYFVDQNNTPVLVLGDSAWSLIVNLTEAQAATYFADRAAHGYNSVLISLFAGPGAFGQANFATYDGIIPFTTPGNIGTPNPAYFQRVDDMINLAASYGLCVFLDPIENYGWETTFENSGVAACTAFGQYLGNRYASFRNIVWSHGNDYQDWPAADSVFLAIINGIKSVDSNHIHTIELNYNNSATFDDSNYNPPVMNVDFAYTYFPSYAEVLHCYETCSVPTILGETIYEQESHGSTDSGTVENVRRQMWWAFTSGASGYLYGSAWTDSFKSGWQSNLDTPGALQLNYLANILGPLEWRNLVPDTSHALVTAGYETPYPYPGNTTGSAVGTLDTNNYVTASLTPDGLFGIAYLPSTTTITVKMTNFAGPVTAIWVDPSSGVQSTAPGSPFKNSGSNQFTSPGNTSDGMSDWVILFEVGQANATPTPTPTPPLSTPATPQGLRIVQ